jgi:hypothetical protein
MPLQACIIFYLAFNPQTGMVSFSCCSPHRVPNITIRYIIITIGIVSLSYLLSILIPDISFVFGIIGATVGM